MNNNGGESALKKVVVQGYREAIFMSRKSHEKYDFAFVFSR